MSQTTETAAELVDRAEINAGGVLVEYSRTEAALAALRERYAGAKFDLTTTTGDKAARAARLELKTLRTSLEGKRKELKAPAVEFGRKIDDEAKRITAEIVALEDPIDAQIKADEARRETERLERERIAAERAAGFRAKIDAIRACVARSQGLTSERIGNGIAQVEAIATDEASFAEFAAEAEQAKTTTLAAMRNLRDLAKAREDEAARLEAQRVENERIAAEQAAQAERLAAQQRALDEQAAKLAAAQKAIDDAKAEAERKEREAAEAKAKADAESSAFESWSRSNAHPTDDVESIRRKWEASPEYHELHGIEYTPAQTTQQAAPEAAAAPVQAADAAPSGEIDVFKDLAGHYRATGQLPARVTHPAAQSFRNEQPTLTLGAMKDRLGFTLTADFLAELGFEATPVKAARLYRESQFGDICDALVRHIKFVRDEVAIAA